MGKFIVGHSSDRTFEALHEAGVISAEPSRVRRCVIDLQVGAAAKVYLETFADDALIDVTLAGGLEIATERRRLEVVADEEPA